MSTKAPEDRVGVLGSGVVGQTLAKAFSTVGYHVKVGSRSPEKLGSWLTELQKTAPGGTSVSAGTFAEAASFGGVIVLAVLGDAAESVIELAGPEKFSNKLVIDASNPLDFSRGRPPGNLEKYATISLGESIQKMLPGSKVVKCFNTVPNSVMFRPGFESSEMLICGDDPLAKQRTTQILKEFGWTGAIDVGGIQSAKWLEALVPLWVRSATAVGSWNSMFQLVRR